MISGGRSAAVQNLRDTVWKQTTIDLGSAHRRKRDWSNLISAELVDEAIEMMRDGIRPVLVLDERGLTLTSDFAISACLAKRGHVSQAVIVVPIADDLRDWLALSEPMTCQRQFTQVSEVFCRNEVKSKKSRRKLLVDSDWSFYIGATK